jgi:sec-independent protein translocase protein TatA
VANFGPTELIIILVIILLLFGAKKLPEMARSLGKSSSEFKKGLSEAPDDKAADKPAEAKDEKPAADDKADNKTE